MRLTLTIAAVLLAVTACGQGEPADSPTSAAPTSEPTPTATEPVGPTSSADLVVSPGAVGPVEAGMTQAEAEATSLFDVDVTDDGCGDTRPLVWKAAFSGVDVLTDPAGTVVSLGIRDADGPRTADGLGVGSTLGELIGVYGGDLTAPEEAGFGQAGVFVQQGDAWLGFLFGEMTVEDVDNDEGSTVSFVEATTGAKPELMRSGC